HTAPSGPTDTYSAGNSGCGSAQIAELGVLNSTRVSPSARPAASSSSGPIVPVGLWTSTTTASPIRTSRGSDSTVAAPSRKWCGGSTWVPVWVPMWISETLAASPLAIRCAGSIRTGGSPGQVSMSGLMGRDISHIRLIRRILVKGGTSWFRNPILPRPLEKGCWPAPTPGSKRGVYFAQSNARQRCPEALTDGGGVGQGPLLFLTRALGAAMFREQWQEIFSAHTGTLRF